jgi:hypothetical protein
VNRRGDLTDELIATPLWTEAMLDAAGIPIEDVELVTVGAGLGSFTLVDTLRIAGVAPSRLMAVGPSADPVETYRYLCQNSQIPAHERLRSDSASTPDNIWGFPSYAVREAAAAPSLSQKLSLLWNVFSEPVFSDYYTPRSGHAFDAIHREAGRIGWAQLHRPGLVRMVRAKRDGGYFVLITPPEGASATRRVAIRTRYVHVGVGYPGVRFLPDLQEYRERHRDYSRVVNAYEPHEHVYTELRRRPGRVVVRGSGIVASRILQRLIDDRDQYGAQTVIIHLFRNYVDGPQGRSLFSRRPGANGFAYQGFNFAKATWGGQLKQKLERTADERARGELSTTWGGTNTPKRRMWREQLTRGRAQGFYVQQVGVVEGIEQGEAQTIRTLVRADGGGIVGLDANFVIDATGLQSDIADHRLLADLLNHSGARRNALGRLAVEPNFEITGTRHGPGRMYASGSATLGGYYAPADSFLGLQYAALRITDDVAAMGFCTRIGTGRSIREWFRWARGASPTTIASRSPAGQVPEPAGPPAYQAPWR